MIDSSRFLSVLNQMNTLPFKVSPEFLEDLGLNLYTSLDKVLVEFIANSHDADATSVSLELDVEGIDKARRELRRQWDLERKRAEEEKTEAPDPLEDRTLPEEFEIVIEDDGHGMSKDEIASKYLQVSRRKRDDEGSVSPGGRVYMGRKGLGKLAGFGVAQKIVVTSLKEGESKATKIVLDFSEIKKFDSMEDVEVPCEILPDKGGIAGDKGTRIQLTRLVYSGLKGTQQTAIRHAVECFWMIDIGDFLIMQNGETVQASKREYEWAYPDEEGRPADQLIHKSIRLLGVDHDIRYRIRFTASKRQLKSHEHGVRIYAHKRLASAPYLFEVPSSSTGYRYTSYLDGIVVADFVDEQPSDYIGTNRQGLRWETPLLSELHNFIGEEIKTALKDYYATKEDTITEKVKTDTFTKSVIGKVQLPKHREKLAYNIAVSLAKGDPEETQSSFYRKSLPIIVKGLSRGDILGVLSKLASDDNPQIADVIRDVTELTKQEFGDFLLVVQGRIDGISTLRKICGHQNFKEANNEKQLQILFEENPWLIDPTFFQFMSADETQESLNDRLAKKLEIGKYGAAPSTDLESPDNKPYGANKRPDLSFILGNKTLKEIVIVELKAPNTPLHSDHLVQLKNYMRRTEDYLEAWYPADSNRDWQVRGILIGSRAPAEESRQEKVKQLKYDERERARAGNAAWEILSIEQVLERTEAAHKEMLDAHERARA